MNTFTLVSPFKPTGDQPEAIKQLVAGVGSKAKHQTLLGVTGSGKTFTMANVIAQTQRPTLVISHNKTLAAQLASEFKIFFPENAVHYFVSYYDYYQPEAYIPQSDTYIEKETQINEEIDRLRHASTQALLTRRDAIIVASVSCIYGLGSPDEYKKQSITLKARDPAATRSGIIASLVSLQFKRNDLALTRGTFRLRGELLDIFPADALDHVIRITFFDKEIERIDLIDPVTGKKISRDPVPEICIFPATHYVAPQEQLEKTLKAIEAEMDDQVHFFITKNKLIEAQRIKERTTFDLEMIRTAGYCNGIENYSRYFDRRKAGEPPYTLIDYFPKDFLMFIDESHMTVPQIRAMYGGDQSRKQQLIDYGFRLPSARDNRPLNFTEFENRINQVVFVTATPDEYELKKSGVHLVEQLIRPTGLLDPTIEVRPLEHQVDDVMHEIRSCIAKNHRALVTTLTKRMAEDLSEYLRDAGIKAYYLHSDIDTFERLEILRDLRSGVYDVVVGINLLREGLDLPEVALVAILDADKEGFLRSQTAFIQTIGRAARHVEGRVIMYAEKMTGSMRRAIEETKRRRAAQMEHNKKHGITPRGIKKAIGVSRLAGAPEAPQEKDTLSSYQPSELKVMTQEQKKLIIRELQAQMELAALNLEFEKAAELRDQISLIDPKQKK